MISHCRGVAFTSANFTAVRAKRHGGKKLAEIRSSRPALYGLRRIRYRRGRPEHLLPIDVDERPDGLKL